MGTRRYPDEPVCCNNDVNRRVSGVRNDKSGRIRRESMYHNNCPLNISRSFASIIKKKKKKKQQQPNIKKQYLDVVHSSLQNIKIIIFIFSH